MSAGDKTLSETVSEVIAEQTNATQENQATETEEGLSKDKTEETQSSGTPVYVAGIDISDIDEQDRPRIKAKLEEKARLLEKGYQPKYQKVAQLEKSLDWLVDQGITPEEAETQLRKYIDQKRNPQAVLGEKKDAVRTLDKIIDQAPLDQKAELERFRQILLEETNIKQLEKKIEALEKMVGYFQNVEMDRGRKSVESELVSLSEKFGEPLIAKYHDVIVREWEKNPNIKAKDILKYAVPDEEYEQAIVESKNKGKKPLTQEKKNAISSQPSGITSSVEKMDVKTSTLGQIISAALLKK